LTKAAAGAGAAPTMCNHPKCQRLAATIIEEELELVAPFLPINKHQESQERERDCECNRETKRENEGLQWQQLQVQQESWKLSRVYVILLLHVCVVTSFLSISNNMKLSRGYKRFVEPR